MSHPTAKPQKTKHPSLFSKIVFTLFKLTLLSLASWFMLMVWFLGESFYKSQNTALQQAQIIAFNNAEFIKNSASSWAHQLTQWLFLFHQGLLSVINHLVIFKVQFIQTFLYLTLAVTEISVTRLFILVLALPLLSLILFVFVTDGLVKRDIRKFQGARESSFLFHRVKQSLGFCFFSPFFIYLSLPFTINPILFLTLQGLLLGMVVHLSTTYFKKYV